jgi:hypothetical protein
MGHGKRSNRNFRVSEARVGQLRTLGRPLRANVTRRGGRRADRASKGLALCLFQFRKQLLEVFATAQRVEIPVLLHTRSVLVAGSNRSS